LAPYGVYVLRRSQDFFELLQEVIPVTVATPAQRAIIGKHASLLVAPGTPGAAGRPGIPGVRPPPRHFPGDDANHLPRGLLTSTSTIVLMLTSVAYLVLCSLFTGRVALESPFSVPTRVLANSVVWVICTQALLQLLLDTLHPWMQQLPPWPVLLHHTLSVARAVFNRTRRWLRPLHGAMRLARTGRGGDGGSRGGDANRSGGDSHTHANGGVGRASRVARETVLSMVREQLGIVRFPEEIGGAEYSVVAEEVQVCVY
jgi:hypothetical protein